MYRLYYTIFSLIFHLQTIIWAHQQKARIGARLAFDQQWPINTYSTGSPTHSLLQLDIQSQPDNGSNFRDNLLFNLKYDFKTMGHRTLHLLRLLCQRDWTVTITRDPFMSSQKHKTKCRRHEVAKQWSVRHCQHGSSFLQWELELRFLMSTAVSTCPRQKPPCVQWQLG